MENESFTFINNDSSASFGSNLREPTNIQEKGAPKMGHASFTLASQLHFLHFRRLVASKQKGPDPLRSNLVRTQDACTQSSAEPSDGCTCWKLPTDVPNPSHSRHSMEQQCCKPWLLRPLPSEHQENAGLQWRVRVNCLTFVIFFFLNSKLMHFAKLC